MANHLPLINEATEVLLPDKSQTKYVGAYKRFMKWHKAQSTNSFSEEVLLAYFGEIAQTFAPASLTTIFWMIKPIINSKYNVDLGQYTRLLSFLKERKKAVGAVQKSLSLHFSADGITKFLTEAPDSQYVAVKAVVVFALCGAWSGELLTNIKMEYVTDYGTEIVVRIPNPDTKAIKVYPISGEMADFVRNYVRLRPKKILTDRFFIQYRNETCTVQHIGKHTMAKMPKMIATYLGSSAPEEFTVGSFRKISPEIVRDVKAKLRSWKRCGVWTSNADCEASEQSFQTTETICGRLSSQRNSQTTNQVLAITREAAQDATFTSNTNQENPQNGPLTPDDSPDIRIKQEDEGEFEAGEYTVGCGSRYDFLDIVVKSENDPEDHHDNENTYPTNRTSPDQRPISHELLHSFSSESNPTKKVKFSSDAEEVSTNTPCQNCSFSQQMIEAQAAEIVRLKELTETQNLKIESLEALLLDNLVNG